MKKSIWLFILGIFYATGSSAQTKYFEITLSDSSVFQGDIKSIEDDSIVFIVKDRYQLKISMDQVVSIRNIVSNYSEEQVVKDPAKLSKWDKRKEPLKDSRPQFYRLDSIFTPAIHLNSAFSSRSLVNSISVSIPVNSVLEPYLGASYAAYSEVEGAFIETFAGLYVRIPRKLPFYHVKLFGGYGFNQYNGQYSVLNQDVAKNTCITKAHNGILYGLELGRSFCYKNFSWSLGFQYRHQQSAYYYYITNTDIDFGKQIDDKPYRRIQLVVSFRV